MAENLQSDLFDVGPFRLEVYFLMCEATGAVGRKEVRQGMGTCHIPAHLDRMCFALFRMSFSERFCTVLI